MSRSVWKKPIILNEKFKKIKNIKDKIIERNFIISSKFLNKIVSIHNGKVFVNVFIDKDKVGFKFGEFVYSRKFIAHKVNKKKSKIKKK